MKFPDDVKNQKSQINKRMKLYTNDVDAINLIESVLLFNINFCYLLFYLKLLTLNPRMRLNCDRALDHEFFWNDPMPICPTKTLEKLEKSMFEYLSVSL